VRKDPEPKNTSILTGDAKMHEVLRDHDGAFHDAFRCNKHTFQALLKLERLNGCGQLRFLAREE